jgi:hypothetical protein
MKLIKLIADIDQPFNMKSGTILVAEDFTNLNPTLHYYCRIRNMKFNVSVNDADELTIEQYLDVVEHINKF